MRKAPKTETEEIMGQGVVCVGLAQYSVGAVKTLPFD